MHSSDLVSQAEDRTREILTVISELPTLRRRVPDEFAGPWQIQVALVTKKQMQELNFRHLGNDRATDVLSFEAPSPFRELGVLGDLVICLPVLKQQAKSIGTGVLGELDVLLVHGTLHLLGLDHEQGPKQAKQMAQWEQRVLARLEPKGGARPGGKSGLAARARATRSLGLIERVRSGTKAK